MAEYLYLMQSNDQSNHCKLSEWASEQLRFNVSIAYLPLRHGLPLAKQIYSQYTLQYGIKDVCSINRNASASKRLCLQTTYQGFIARFQCEFHFSDPLTWLTF